VMTITALGDKNEIYAPARRGGRTSQAFVNLLAKDSSGSPTNPDAIVALLNNLKHLV
jgi:hypothetical protein